VFSESWTMVQPHGLPRIATAVIATTDAARSPSSTSKGSWPAQSTPEVSTGGVVGVAEDVRLELQIFQTMLDYIADADDTGEPAIA
jgi:hypothetical protein